MGEVFNDVQGGKDMIVLVKCVQFVSSQGGDDERTYIGASRVGEYLIYACVIRHSDSSFYEV